MSLFEIRIESTDDGLFCRFPGQVYGHIGAPIVWTDPYEKIVVVKQPGRHVHSGQGSPWRYSPGRYEVYKVVGRYEFNHDLDAERLGEWPLR